MTAAKHRSTPAGETGATSKQIDNSDNTLGGVDAATLADFTIKVSEAPKKNSPRWPTRGLLWSEHVDSVLNPKNRKECGGYLLGTTGKSNRRTNENVFSRSGVNIDVDYPSDDFDERAEALFKKLGCAGTVHPTFSSTEEEPRRRVTIPFNRDADPDEWLQISKWVGSLLEGERDKGEIDEASYTLSQMMWKPATPDLSTYDPQIYPGQPLDVDAALQEAPELPPPASTRQDYTGDGTPYEDLDDGQKQAADEAVDRRVGAWRSIIQHGLTLGPKECDKHGRGWERMSYKSAWSLALLGYAPWSPIDLDDARELYDELIPWEFTRTKECRDKWDSAVVKIVRSQKIVPAPWDEAAADFDVIDGFDDLVHDSDITEVSRQNSIEALFPRARMRELFNMPERDWVVEGLVLEGTHTAVVAPAGHMKSLIMFAIAVAIARGDVEFAGMRIPRQRRVFYLDMELTPYDHRDRLASFGIGEDDDELLEQLVLISLPPGMAPLDTAEGGRGLLEALKHYGIERNDLVVLDSFQRVTEGAEDKSDTTRAFTRHTGDALKSAGYNVLRSDNSGKDVTRGSRGTSGKRDDVDVEYLLQREDLSDPDSPDVDSNIRFIVNKGRQAGSVRGRVINIKSADNITTFSPTGLLPNQEHVEDIKTWLNEKKVKTETGEVPVLALIKAEADDRDKKVWTRALVRLALKERKTPEFEDETGLL